MRPSYSNNATCQPAHYGLKLIRRKINQLKLRAKKERNVEPLTDQSNSTTQHDHTSFLFEHIHFF